MSALFEILEISAQDVMVNFQECWWDHAILDLCGANAAGIFVGMSVVHYLELKTYLLRGICIPVRNKSHNSHLILGLNYACVFPGVGTTGSGCGTFRNSRTR